jgi:hypothetical protein
MKKKRKPQIVISCHADTCFDSHQLIHTKNKFVGHLDNFAGVHAVMSAYFSGKITNDMLRIELTYGEETGMAGAREVLSTLTKDDMVVVVDVTGTPTSKDITIEKCRTPRLQQFANAALKGLSYQLFEGCHDPISCNDECDVYDEKLKNVFFLGIPCVGGDYNSIAVSCRKNSIVTASKAIVRLANQFPVLWK